MAVLIKNAFCILSNCTGVSHIASALNTKGLIISMDGEPGRWRPLNKEVLKTIDWTRNPDFEMAKAQFQALFQPVKAARES